jgi:hypothetical protein
MRRLFLPLVCFILLAFVSSTGARMSLMISGGAPAAAGCSSVAQAEAIGDYDDQFPAGSNGNEYVGTKFVASSTTTICAIEVYIEKDNSPVGDTNACIYTHDAGEDDPDSAVDCSDSVNANTWPADGSPALFKYETGLSAAITNTTTYWVVIFHDGDNTNNGDIWRGDSATERTVKDADGLGTWTLATATKTIAFNLYE